MLQQKMQVYITMKNRQLVLNFTALRNTADHGVIFLTLSKKVVRHISEGT